MRTGGCRCGAIGFSIGGEPLGGVACHCRDCQYASGGAANLSWVFESAGFKIEKGNPRGFKANPYSGGTFFCDNCGVQVFSYPDSDPELIAIKVGAFDDPSGFTVGADIWMSSAPLWHRSYDGAAQFKEDMPKAAK